MPAESDLLPPAKLSLPLFFHRSWRHHHWRCCRLHGNHRSNPINGSNLRWISVVHIQKVAFIVFYSCLELLGVMESFRTPVVSTCMLCDASTSSPCFVHAELHGIDTLILEKAVVYLQKQGRARCAGILCSTASFCTASAHAKQL